MFNYPNCKDVIPVFVAFRDSTPYPRFEREPTYFRLFHGINRIKVDIVEPETPDEEDAPEKRSIFAKPNDQIQTRLSFGMARRGRMKSKTSFPSKTASQDSPAFQVYPLYGQDTSPWPSCAEREGCAFNCAGNRHFLCFSNGPHYVQCRTACQSEYWRCFI